MKHISEKSMVPQAYEKQKDYFNEMYSGFFKKSLGGCMPR